MTPLEHLVYEDFRKSIEKVVELTEENARLAAELEHTRDQLTVQRIENSPGDPVDYHLRKAAQLQFNATQVTTSPFPDQVLAHIRAARQELENPEQQAASRDDHIVGRVELMDMLMDVYMYRLDYANHLGIPKPDPIAKAINEVVDQISREQPPA